MSWFLLSIFCAFTLSTADALTKFYFSQEKLYNIVFFRFFGSLPFLVVPLAFISWPHLSLEFWITLAFLLPLEITAFFLYMRAITISPLSLTIPFLAFTPLFMILTGSLILGESLSKQGIFGIILIVTGAYILHFEKGGDFLAPFKGILKEKGSLLMLIVAFIYSITSVLGKKCVLLSDPVFFGLFYYPLVSVVGMSLICVVNKGNVPLREATSFKVLSVGFFQAASILSHMIAISLIEAAYMIAVKRTTLVFSVLYGYFLFKESNFPTRLVGSLLMLAGCIVIYLYG